MLGYIITSYLSFGLAFGLCLITEEKSKEDPLYKSEYWYVYLIITTFLWFPSLILSLFQKSKD